MRGRSFFLPARRQFSIATILFLITAFLVAAPAGPAAADPPRWRYTGELNVAHVAGAGTPMVKLTNGKILVASGNTADGSRTAVSELYDPATGVWSRTGSLANPRLGSSNLVRLTDGRVLITGGSDQNVDDYASTEIYNPATGLWSGSGDLNTPRRNLFVIGLRDGRVLAATGARGAPDGGRFLDTTEIFDPATGRWTAAAPAPTRRESAFGILLADGRAMIIGGYSCCDYFTPETDLFDPTTNTWTRAGDRPHGGGGAALALLPDGRVLSVGGDFRNAGAATVPEAALFDPATGQWSATTPPRYIRSGADAIVLASGKVLVAGGGPTSTELFDPATNTWTDGPALNTARVNAHLVGLDNGDILIATGQLPDGTPTTTTELYSAPTNPLGPDLTPTAITYAAADLVAGRRIHFDSGISNSGDIGTPVFNVRWLVDGQNVGAYGSHAGIPAGATVLDGNSQLDWTFTIPGPHTVSFLVDVDGMVAEQNEANNSTQTSFTVARAPVLKYAALGDSIASGHGLDTTYADKDAGRNDTSCQRSTGRTAVSKSYADLVREQLTLPSSNYYKIACTGDTVTNLLAIQVPQAEAKLGKDASLITITIGADNLQFNEANTYFQAFNNYDAYKSTRATQLNTVRRVLTQALGILGRGKPQRQIIVTGYFNPFNTSSFLYKTFCQPTPIRQTTCRTIVNETVQLLNTAIAGAVTDYHGTTGDAPVSLVDGNSTIAAAFLGHESPRPTCGTAPPDATVTYIQARPNTHVLPPKNGNDCFHPNPTGHAVLARLVYS